MARQSLLSVILGLDSSRFTKGMTKAQQGLTKTANRLSSIGRTMSLSVSAPLVAIGASAFKVSSDFELAMKKVKAISGATGQDFQLLEKSAKDLGSSTVFSASEVASLQLELAKLGVSAKGIEGATGSILGLAQAFGTDLGPTAETVQQTINQFGLEAEDAGRVADVLATSFSKSGLDLEKFSGSMANAGILSSQFGFSLEETTSLLGVLANNGLSGADAGTKLKMAFSQLASEGVDVKETFGAIINGSLDYSQAIDILGKRSAILAPLFGKNLEDLNDLNKELLNAGGSAKDMAGEMDASAKGGIASMRSAIEGAQIELGTALAPTILEVANKIKELAQGFTRLDPTTKKLIVNVGLIVTAIGPVSFAISGMIKGFVNAQLAVKAFTTSLLTNPFTALAVAVGAVASALFVMGNESVIADDKVLDFNETIDAQNDLLKESVKQLASRSALLKTAFEGGGTKTVQDLQGQLRALNTELQNLSPEALAQFDNFSISLASDPLEQARLGIVNAFDATTGTFSEEARQTNLAIISEASGVNLSPAILDIINSLDPFGASQSVQEQFDEIVGIINGRIAELETELEDAEGQIQTKVEIIIDDSTDTTKTKDTLASIQADLEKSLDDIGELEVLFGKDLDSEKFSLIESAIKKIVEADFANSTEALETLRDRMEEFREKTDAVATPMDLLKQTFQELQVSQSLGIIDDLETATNMVSALETALRDSILADPNFINTEQFENLNEQLELLRSKLEEGKVAQDSLNESFDIGQTVGDAMSQVVSAGFDSMTNSSQTFGEAVSQIFLNLLKGALSTAIGNAIASAFSPASPDNIATGGAAAPIKAAGLTAIVTSLFGKIPKLHSGGLTLGPTLAMIGDNPSGREAVIPFERMGEFLGQVAGQGQNMNITGKISGHDIILSQERALRQRGR